jgi:hypothetical protein
VTNTEFLMKEFKDKVLSNFGNNLDNYIELPASDNVEHMFFDPATNKVLEISFKDHEMQHHQYYFDSHRMPFCIKQTKHDGKFICIDWTVDELTILAYKIDQYGIKNYIIKSLPYKPLEEDIDLYQFHELVFSDMADSSTFEVYFQQFFHDHSDTDVNKILAKNKLLD